MLANKPILYWMPFTEVGNLPPKLPKTTAACKTILIVYTYEPKRKICHTTAPLLDIYRGENIINISSKV